MVKRTFVIADTHFGHKNICQFSDKYGKQLRPWNNPDDMDEAMVTLWNETVRPEDKVYCLGDIAINRRCISTIGRCNGDKVLIKGNHDIAKLKEFTPYFRDIRACQTFGKVILTHIPIHPQCMDRWDLNIHGHLHTENIKLKKMYFSKISDPRYFCVSAEQINYKPILLEEAIEKLKQQLGE